MTIQRRAAVPVFLAVLALAGCSGATDTAAPSVTASTAPVSTAGSTASATTTASSAPSATPTPTPSAAPARTAAKRAALAVGGPTQKFEPLEGEEGSSSVRVLDYRRDEKGMQVDGRRIDAVRIRFCISDDYAYADEDGNVFGEVSISSVPWRLVTPEGGRFKAFNNGNGYSSNGDPPQPAYPGEDGEVLEAGDCIEGWLPFFLPPKTVVSAVTYRSEARPGPATVWAVK